MFCGALGSWGAVGAAGVGAPVLVGWPGGVCVQGWALGDVPQADGVLVRLQEVKPVRTPVAILGPLGVCIYVPASRHWLISYSPIHLI